MNVGNINIVRVLIKSHEKETVTVTLKIERGNFEFVDVRDGKCIKHSSTNQTKVVEACAECEVFVLFYFKLIDEGEYDLEVQAKAESGSDVISGKIKTYGETKKICEFCDLSAYNFDNKYIQNDDRQKNIYETRCVITGNAKRIPDTTCRK